VPKTKFNNHLREAQRRTAGSLRKSTGAEQSSAPELLPRNNQLCRTPDIS